MKSKIATVKEGKKDNVKEVSLYSFLSQENGGKVFLVWADDVQYRRNVMLREFT